MEAFLRRDPLSLNPTSRRQAPTFGRQAPNSLTSYTHSSAVQRFHLGK